MSQRVVEATLGRLLCDDAFRREWERDCDDVVNRYGLELTHSETECLRAIRVEALERCTPYLDDRIRRADPEFVAVETERHHAMTLLLQLMVPSMVRGH